MVKYRDKQNHRPVKLWTYFRDFKPPMREPIKFREWNIIPRPVMHNARHDRARLQ
jgi:hypothetical protein